MRCEICNHLGNSKGTDVRLDSVTNRWTCASCRSHSWVPIEEYFYSPQDSTFLVDDEFDHAFIPYYPDTGRRMPVYRYD